MATDWPDYTIGFAGVLQVPNGGTGLQTVPSGALMYGNLTGAFGTIAAPATGQVLTSNGVGTPPSWRNNPQLGTIRLNSIDLVTQLILANAPSGFNGYLLELFVTGPGDMFTVDQAGNVVTKTLALSTPLPVTSGGTGVASCTAGQILTASGANTAAFATPPGCRVYNSADINLPLGVTYPTFNSERYNNGACHSTSVNPSRLTAPIAGVYLITWTGLDTGGNLQDEDYEIQLNHTTSICNGAPYDLAGGYHQLSLATLYHLSANDYVEMRINNEGAGAHTLKAIGNQSAEFAMQWVGP